MKFPRSARIFRGHLDIAPFASVFFLLVIFVMLGALIYTPGIPVELQLPQANGKGGVSYPKPSIVDRLQQVAGRFDVTSGLGIADRVTRVLECGSEDVGDSKLVAIDRGRLIRSGRR